MLIYSDIGKLISSMVISFFVLQFSNRIIVPMNLPFQFTLLLQLKTIYLTEGFFSRFSIKFQFIRNEHAN